MTFDLDTAHELALCLTNENTDLFPYKERLDIAQDGPHNQSVRWTALLNKYGAWYRATYTTPEYYAPSTILAAAAEVAEYYERHVAELAA